MGMVGGSGGQGGGGGTLPLAAPYGVSSHCGDAILDGSPVVGDAAYEECDDGDGVADACTASCKTRDQLAVADGVDRYQGVGRHPVSGLDQGFIATFVEFPHEEPQVGATLFDIWGRATRHVAVSEDAFPIEEANPVAAALPGGDYAVAWADFDGDGSDLGIALRKVHADGSLGPLLVANAQTDFSQRNPDLLWTGSKLVVAWEDYADASNGPDLRYRVFDQNLSPLGGDVTAAASSAPEAAVALASFNGSIALAYRETIVSGDYLGQENVVVQAGGKSYRLGPMLGGAPEDRPALTALDATHLLLAFSVGTDPNATGTHNTPRLRYSVIDTASASEPTSRALDPLDDVLSRESQVAQLSPTLALGSDGYYLAWRSEARPGDGGGDELWLKLLRWNAAGTPALDAREPEMLIPRTCEASFGDQRQPSLAHVDLPPNGALAIAWDDYSHSQGPASGDPDVVVHYAPIHPRAATQSLTFTESWEGSNGAAWPAYWSTVVAPGATLNADIQSDQGQLSGSSALNSGMAYVNDRAATNLEMVTKVRFSSSAATAGLIARVEPATRTYLTARFGSLADQLRLSAMIDGTLVEIAGTPLPYAFQSWSPKLDFYLKFRVVTDASGTTTLAAKYWLTDLPEPNDWGVSASLPASLPTSSPLYAVKTRLGNASGPFGVFHDSSLAGRTSTFDDLRITYLDGAQLGDPTAALAPIVPFARRPADDRTCTDTQQCGVAQGCCNDPSECQADLQCSNALSDLLGLGSHAKTCAAKHCTNNVLDADEVRADCGGADCPPCGATCNTTRGTAFYAVPGCPGGIGDADCSGSDGCLPGLICGPSLAYRYGWDPVAADDVCIPQHCVNRVKDPDELGPDWGGPCGPVKCYDSPNGGYQHCTVSCPCAVGQGGCHLIDECKKGLICGANGAPFGIVGSVCVPAGCNNHLLDAAQGETTADCGGACGCVGCPTGCQGLPSPQGTAITIPTSAPYVENFDSMGTSATATLPAAWRIDSLANPRTLGTYAAAGTVTTLSAGASMSSSATNGIYNFGSGSAAMGLSYWLDSTDRALGWLATGTTVAADGTKSGNLYVQLAAPPDDDITGVTVSYRVEKYRKGTTTPGWKIQLYYSVNGVNWATAGSAFTTSFTADAQAGGYDPAPGSSTAVSGTIPPYVMRGTSLYLAWSYTTTSASAVNAASAPALAIDDVSILGAVSQ